jgi:hypothetical protein
VQSAETAAATYRSGYPRHRSVAAGRRLLHDRSPDSAKGQGAESISTGVNTSSVNTPARKRFQPVARTTAMTIQTSNRDAGRRGHDVYSLCRSKGVATRESLASQQTSLLSCVIKSTRWRCRGQGVLPRPYCFSLMEGNPQWTQRVAGHSVRLGRRLPERQCMGAQTGR